ncbi:MAG: tRNA 2-thiouridine(34) synthase MnmA [Pseudomonadales bacterium]|jgi:tRNA-specific 2-thiouridylase|nr:tRNA 2-thiouridine(34) synthase MnmA [Pseudomonadales bacterium]
MSQELLPPLPAGARVVVGMSGGVDSSVAALRLLEAGCRVEGLFMKNWEEDDGTEYCTAKEDLADARAVCERLGIPLHTANFAAEYWDAVFEAFLAEYRAGRTPNPDVLCNREIKFAVFLEYAELLGADYVATGHYARLAVDGDRVRLLRAVDEDKDQTYFLQAVPGERFRRCLFPLGDLTKPEVRAIAARAGFENHAKKDSTGICFIGERRFADFLERYVARDPGPIETPDGTVLGEHRGLSFYTIGQRQGLGIGGRRDGDGDPWYVAEKDLAGNVLRVVQGADHPALFHDRMTVPAPAWIDGAPASPARLTARIRHRQALQPCTLHIEADGAVVVDFDSPQRAVTPGQWACFYDGEQCLGGGVIERRARTEGSALRGVA